MFVKCVVGMSKENYDSIQVLAKIADYENTRKELNHYKEEINRTEKRICKIESRYKRSKK